MVLVGLSRLKWWMTGALIVALTSLAYAKPSFVSHEGHGLFGGASSFHGSSFGGPVHGNTVPRANISRDMPRGVAMSGHAGRYARNEAPRTRGNASGRRMCRSHWSGPTRCRACTAAMHRTTPHNAWRFPPTSIAIAQPRNTSAPSMPVRSRLSAPIRITRRGRLRPRNRRTSVRSATTSHATTKNAARRARFRARLGTRRASRLRRLTVTDLSSALYGTFRSSVYPAFHPLALRSDRRFLKFSYPIFSVSARPTKYPV